MSLRKRVDQMKSGASGATASEADTAAPAMSDKAKDSAAGLPLRAAEAAPISRETENSEKAPEWAENAENPAKTREIVRNSEENREKSTVSEQKVQKIAPSKVPPTVAPLAEPGMGTGEMRLRTGAEADVARIQVTREAQDAFEALRDRLQYLNAPDQRELQRLLSTELQLDGDDFDHEFDLQEEVNAQLRMLRSLRSRADRENLSVRETRDVLSSASTLIQMLIKEQEKVVNIDRLRTIEKAVVEAVQTLPQEQQDIFLKNLEGKLDGYDRRERSSP